MLQHWEEKMCSDLEIIWTQSQRSYYFSTCHFTSVGPLLVVYRLSEALFSLYLTRESHSLSALMLMKDSSPFAPVITPSCSQRTIKSISSPSFHRRYLQTCTQSIPSPSFLWHSILTAQSPDLEQLVQFLKLMFQPPEPLWCWRQTRPFLTPPLSFRMGSCLSKTLYSCLFFPV